MHDVHEDSNFSMINKNPEGSAGNISISSNKEKNISYKSEIMINLLQLKEKGTLIKNCKDNHDTDTTKNHYRRYKIKCE